MNTQTPAVDHVKVVISDTPSLREVSDRAKMAYLGQLMEEENSHIASVAQRMNCTEANVRKAIRHLVGKYGPNS